jgi:hypothetical protein
VLAFLNWAGMDAACMNVASPSNSARSRSHVARSRDVSSRGSPLPSSSALVSGFGSGWFLLASSAHTTVPG